MNGSIYSHYLPHAFPWVIPNASKGLTGIIVGTLIAGDDIAAEGSSFAVTVDWVESDHRHVWLSEASRLRVDKAFENQGAIPPAYLNTAHLNSRE